MKKYLLAFLFLIFAITGHEKRDKELERCAVTSNYIVSNHAFDNETLYLNFEVYPKFSKEVYEDPMWSVKIVDYRSDGVSIKPQYYPVIFFSHINSRKMRAQDGKLLFETGLWSFYTGEYVGGDDLFQKIHGHSFAGTVRIEGSAQEDKGWVRDLWKIERIIAEEIKPLDHSLLNEIDGLEQPALEQIALWIFERLEPRLPGLACVEVRRPTCGERARVRK